MVPLLENCATVLSAVVPSIPGSRLALIARILHPQQLTHSFIHAVMGMAVAWCAAIMTKGQSRSLVVPCTGTERYGKVFFFLGSLFTCQVTGGLGKSLVSCHFLDSTRIAVSVYWVVKWYFMSEKISKIFKIVMCGRCCVDTVGFLRVIQGWSLSCLTVESAMTWLWRAI